MFLKLELPLAEVVDLVNFTYYCYRSCEMGEIFCHLSRLVKEVLFYYYFC